MQCELILVWKTRPFVRTNKLGNTVSMLIEILLTHFAIYSPRQSTISKSMARLYVENIIQAIEHLHKLTPSQTLVPWSCSNFIALKQCRMWPRACAIALKVSIQISILILLNLCGRCRKYGLSVTCKQRKWIHLSHIFREFYITQYTK